MGSQRQLRFENWDEVRSDLDALLGGYEVGGKWNLAQIALHLNDWLKFPMEGFPQSPAPMRLLLSVIRSSVGRRQLRKILTTGQMPRGSPTLPATVYRAASQEQDIAAVSQLKQTIGRFEEFDGPIAPSPVFGEMDKTTAEKLQLLHFANHLRWLRPTPPSPGR